MFKRIILTLTLVFLFSYFSTVSNFASEVDSVASEVNSVTNENDIIFREEFGFKNNEAHLTEVEKNMIESFIENMVWNYFQRKSKILKLGMKLL